MDREYQAAAKQAAEAYSKAVQAAMNAWLIRMVDSPVGTVMPAAILLQEATKTALQHFVKAGETAWADYLVRRERKDSTND